MTEKDFARDLIKGLKGQGAYAEKWPDLARAVTKPYDIAASYERQFMPIECKLREFHGKERLPSKTVIISPADFKGRKHQLPGLLKMWHNKQAFPYVAAFIVLHRELKQPLKHGWMIPMHWFTLQDTFTLGDMIGHQREWGLIWAPNIGWTCPWLPTADPARLVESET